MRKFIINLLIFFRNLNWVLEIYKLRRKIGTLSLPILDIKGKSIIIVPHADDEWISCSTLLSQYSDDICLLYMDMLGGDDVITHKERERELREIVAEFKLDFKILNVDKVNNLNHCIREYKPSYIFLPFFFDWHEEHIQCMRMVEQALLRCKEEIYIAMYQVSLPIAATKMLTHVRPMSKREWSSKWRIFANVYKTQNMIPYKRFANYERVVNLHEKYYAVEVFSVHKASQWLRNVNDWILTEEERSLAKKSLNNLTKIFNILGDFRRRREWKE